MASWHLREKADGCLERTVLWKGQAEGRNTAFSGNDREEEFWLTLGRKCLTREAG